MTLRSALISAVLGISFVWGGLADAQSVFVKYIAGACGGPNVCYIFSVTNNLGGTNRIYQFGEDILFSIEQPPGFESNGGGGSFWTDDNYETAIAPGQTAIFESLVGSVPLQIFQMVSWEATAESGPNGNPVFLEGVAYIPEPSTWAMMLLGFAGIGFAGYRASRRTVATAT